MTGGLISGRLNLHNIPIKPVFDYGIDLIIKSRIKNREYMFDSDEFLGIFMRMHYHEILIINGRMDKRTGLEQGAIKEPRNALSIRYEPDTKLLFISASAWREECNKRLLNFDETLKPYRKNKALIIHPNGKVIKNKRMFVGTSASTKAAIGCLWFDVTKIDSFDEKALMGKDNEDPESSDSD